MSLFNVVYADPAWKYKNQRTGGSGTSGAAQKYPVMSVEDIMAIGPLLRKVTARSSILFLWAVNPMPNEAQAVMRAWGYTYKAELVWHKTSGRGIGYWFRNDSERLLIGIRGRVPCFRDSRSNVVGHRRLGHSKKPEVFRSLIEETAGRVLAPASFLELFATRQAPGWTCLGYDIDGQDIRSSLLHLAGPEQLALPGLEGHEGR